MNSFTSCYQAFVIFDCRSIREDYLLVRRVDTGDLPRGKAVGVVSYIQLLPGYQWALHWLHPLAEPTRVASQTDICKIHYIIKTTQIRQHNKIAINFVIKYFHYFHENLSQNYLIEPVMIHYNNIYKSGRVTKIWSYLVIKTNSINFPPAQLAGNLSWRAFSWSSSSQRALDNGGLMYGVQSSSPMISTCQIQQILCSVDKCSVDE